MVRNQDTYYAKSPEETLEELKTRPAGLSDEEAKKRQRKYGLNEIPEKKQSSPVWTFFKQFHSILIYILIVAAVISIFISHFFDAYVIGAIILINAVMGFIQEFRAERAIRALKKMLVLKAKVFRKGKPVLIDAKHLVPGDIIFLEEGDRIPADARILELKNFTAIESPLTGESMPIPKELKVLPKKTLLADSKNMVWMGTFAASGEAKAIVVATGSTTKLGEIAQTLKSIKQPKTHFEKKTNYLAKTMGLIALTGAVIVFITGYFFRGMNAADIFLTALASLIFGIPEGLPAVLTIVLAIGAYRMSKKHAIIRTLPATETLGVVTAIATDKTGTLTKNTMNVEKISIPGEEDIEVTGEGWNPYGIFLQKKERINPLKNPRLSKLLRIASICNNASIKRKDGSYGILGDPTEGALVVLGAKAGLKKEQILKKEKRIDDLPFNPELKYRASLSVLLEKDAGKTGNKSKEIYAIGAPEQILKECSHVLKDKEKRMTKKTKKEILNKIDKMAKESMRVLGLAYKRVYKKDNVLNESMVKEMVFIGVVGMTDPPRKEVAGSIEKARRAGIRVIMKTGDHRETAIAIAEKIGLIGSEEEKERRGKYPVALTEKELQGMSDKKLSDALKHVSVFARLTPESKLRIITILQKHGHIVAMTGDGINDAPALKKADIGIAMGKIGTDVARESSEIVLANDNFASIVDAVEQGRAVFMNVRQTSTHLITTSVAGSATIVSSLVFGYPLILLPVQILWLNLVTAGTGDVALATETCHEDVLEMPPRNKEENILNAHLIPFILMFAVIMAAGTIILFRAFLPQGIEKARTAAFISMMLFQLFNLWNMRSLKKSIFKIGIFSNFFINFDLIFSIGASLLLIYLPIFQSLFQFVILSFAEWVMLTAVALSVLVFGEVYKWVRYKGRNKNNSNTNRKKSSSKK